MSAQIKSKPRDLLDADVRKQIDAEIAKYPPERKSAAGLLQPTAPCLNSVSRSRFRAPSWPGSAPAGR